MTEAIRQTFFDILNGELPDSHGWLTYVYPQEDHLREDAQRRPPRRAVGNRRTRSP